MEEKWIGVDLDGTLAYYDHWRGVDHIGEPVPLMLERVRRWLNDGRMVKIVTARVSHPQQRGECRDAIEAWCLVHLGRVLEITSEKDFQMVELWDDRCIQVVPNTGQRADGKAN